MDSNSLGNKGIMWAILGGEMLDAVFELRYMILFSAILILADFWWGHSDSMKRYMEAIAVSKLTVKGGMEKEESKNTILYKKDF